MDNSQQCTEMNIEPIRAIIFDGFLAGLSCDEMASTIAKYLRGETRPPQCLEHNIASAEYYKWHTSFPVCQLLKGHKLPHRDSYGREWPIFLLSLTTVCEKESMKAIDFYNANATNIVNVPRPGHPEDPSGIAGVRRAMEAQYFAKDALVMSLVDACQFAEAYRARAHNYEV